MKIETTLEQMRDSYDWPEAVSYSDDKSSRALDGAATDGFGLDDVAEVLASEDGCNDEYDWLALFRLNDGRFAFLSAGCDYTGWD